MSEGCLRWEVQRLASDGALLGHRGQEAGALGAIDGRALLPELSCRGSLPAGWVRQIIGDLPGLFGIGAGWQSRPTMEVGHRFLIARQLPVRPLHAAVICRPPPGIKQPNDVVLGQQLFRPFVPEGAAVVGLENQGWEPR